MILFPKLAMLAKYFRYPLVSQGWFAAILSERQVRTHSILLIVSVPNDCYSFGRTQLETTRMEVGAASVDINEGICSNM